MYTCGTDTHGQMGLNNGLKKTGNNIVFSPTVIKAISMYKVRMLAAGNFHSIFFTTSGEIWSSGQCNLGSLGEGKVSRLPIPGIDFEKQDKIEIMESPQIRKNIITSVTVSGAVSSFATALGNSYVLAPSKTFTAKDIENAVSMSCFSEGQFSSSFDHCVGTWIHPKLANRYEIPTAQVVRLSSQDSGDHEASTCLRDLMYFTTPVLCLPIDS